MNFLLYLSVPFPHPSRRALGVLSASYLMGNGFLPWVKAAVARC